MRRLSFVVLLALFASLLPSGRTAFAASLVVNETGAQPGYLNPGYQFTASADTAFGQGVTVEVNPVGTNDYPRYSCYYLNGSNLPGGTSARFRCDTTQDYSAGTQVRYQLMVCDYGTTNTNCQAYTGFNWTFTVQAQTGDIQWGDVLHDSFDAAYRSKIGPVTAGSGSVKLRLRTAQQDITGARVRVWNDRLNQETYYPMAWDEAFDNNNTTYDWWSADIPVGTDPTALYYFFEINDNSDQDFYVDDDSKFLGGGRGAMSDGYDDGRSFQITVYKPTFSTPEWMQRGIIYQIFPDRFRDGNPANNPQDGRFSYDRAGGAIVRSNGTAWNTTVCDPRDKQGAAFNCTNYYGDNFYGGDLKGVTQKIQDGYFSSLGVTVLYLNPIFLAPSNHKYDTADFLRVDPDFGTLQDFKDMIAAAESRGIKVMLDGVFNHTSSDSPYFDYYKRFPETGACESSSSPFYSWFYFSSSSYGGENGGTCANGSGGAAQNYRAWYGYGSLPKIDSSLPQVRQYFYGTADGSDSDNLPDGVGPYWTKLGASGWRFDVGADVDPGLTNDAGNSYWEQFRAAVRNQSVTGKNDTVMLGEEWGDGTPWLLGDEWDSVMNYRFRSAVLSWLFTGCTGNGCSNNGTKFQENDSNDGSSSGAISYLSPSDFNARLRSIQEDYPANAFNAMMNLAGSHDTQRVRFMLKKINNDSDAAAVQRMKEWWLFAFTYAGAPTLYYGDEVGLSHDGVWDGTQFQDDPYNRAPFPWDDASGSAYSANTGLQEFARYMASVRQSYRALQDGAVQHGLVIDDAKKLYGFARTNATQTALVLLNRSDSDQSASFTGLNAAPYNLPNGTVLVNALNPAQTYTVSGGAISVTVSSNWGVVLIQQSKADIPAAPQLSAAGVGADVKLTWPIVTTDSAATPEPEVVTSYQVFRSSGAGYTEIESLANPTFGGAPSYTDVGAAMGGYTYIVRACNAVGRCADSAAVSPSKQTATLSVSPVSATYGGNVTLQATLTAGSSNLSGRSVTFSLNGAEVGSATTNAQGVATLANVSLGTIGASDAPYVGGVGASFGGDNAYNPAADSAALSVAKASASIALGNLSPTYDGTAKNASATTTPAGLSVSLSYTRNGQPVAAPTNAGSYAITATIVDNNYEGSATGTLEIAKATATITLNNLDQAYTGTPRPVEVVTEPAGLEGGVSVTYNGAATAPASVGSYTVAATLTNANYTGSASGTLTIVSADQTITFDPLGDKTFGDDAFTVSATASSGLAVSFSASGDCTSSGALVTITGAGSCSITASQAGDGSYDAAPDVTRSFTINKAAATVSLGGLSQTYDGSPRAASATTSPSGLSVSISYTKDGETIIAPTDAGSYAVTASIIDDDYQGSASGTLQIARASQTINLSGVPASVAVGGTFNVIATASSGLPVSLAVSGQCSISGTTVTATATGSCVVTASQAGDANYNAAPSVNQATNVVIANFAFNGFFAPVNNPPFVNTVKAGSAIPVKFSLGGSYGLNIFAAGYPQVRALTCSASAPTDPIASTETVPATANALSYDAATGQYTYVWKTDRGWGGSCRQLVLQFSDGTTQTAAFNFTR